MGGVDMLAKGMPRASNRDVLKLILSPRLP